MTSPLLTFAVYVAVLGALMGVPMLLWWAFAGGPERIAAEHDRRMAVVRKHYPQPFTQPSNVTAVTPRSDCQHVVVVPPNRLPHSRAR